MKKIFAVTGILGIAAIIGLSWTLSNPHSGIGSASYNPSSSQIQTDWTAGSGIAHILHQPTTFPGIWGNITGSLASQTDLVTALALKSGIFTTLSGYGITDAYPISGNPSGFLTSSSSLAWAKVTGAPAFLTGITSSQITTALTFTPYNATNPSGYITAASIPAPLYSSYQASVTQTGTNAPTSMQLANNFSGGITFTWARTGIGTYTITASSAVFTSGKTKVFFGPLNNALGYINATITSTTVITINTTVTSILSLVLTTGNADAMMSAMPIDVRVYP